MRNTRGKRRGWKKFSLEADVRWVLKPRQQKNGQDVSVGEDGGMTLHREQRKAGGP